jgi:hypothetical protein
MQNVLRLRRHRNRPFSTMAEKRDGRMANAQKPQWNKESLDLQIKT